MKKALSTLILSLSLNQNALAEPLTYNKLYLSYVSANAAKSIASYVKQQSLGGVFVWELRGDSGFNESNSLLKTISTSLSHYRLNNEEPLVMAYWGNWNVYSRKPNHAIPQLPYGVPGSRDHNGSHVINQDFSDKLAGINAITYSFLEAQGQTYSYYDSKKDETVTLENKTPELIGTLYFNDPWADLATPGVSPVQDAFCRKNHIICDFSLTNRTDAIELKDGGKMGNFNAFANLRHVEKNNLLGPLRRLISVGGYGHDASFEDTFHAPQGIDNFVNSAKFLVTTYQLDGIELAYQNPQMSSSNAKYFAYLIKQLKEAIPDKIISVAILSDPEYINGTRDGHHGFSQGTLREIAQYATNINLITYDFNGAFGQPPEHVMTTGFLTNLTVPANTPTPYHFSTENSVKTALNAGVLPEQLIVGIPAYGRALTGISSDNGGLFNPISSITTVPRGDLDLAQCRTKLPPFKANNCTGTFQYKYIVSKMLGQGLIETDYKENDVIIGTTAYASSWSPPTQTNYQLKITNLGGVGDLAFNVTIGDFNAPDFFNLSNEKSYDAETTASINGKQKLTVKWLTITGISGQCETLFDFTKNMQVILKVVPDDKNSQYITLCAFVDLGV